MYVDIQHCMLLMFDQKGRLWQFFRYFLLQFFFNLNKFFEVILSLNTIFLKDLQILVMTHHKQELRCYLNLYKHYQFQDHG